MFFNKNLNASRPSEHPPVRGGNVKTFRWDHRLQIQKKKLRNILTGSPMVVTLGQYHVGEKPTVILLYPYLHGSPCRDTKQKTKTKQKQCSTSLNRIVIIYDISAIEPYNRSF